METIGRRAALGAVAVLAAPGLSRAQARRLTVASKLDAEGRLLGHLIAQVLEGAGIAVANRVGLGATSIVRGALVAGEVDIYPEYTGNGAYFFNQPDDPAWRDAEAGYALVRRLDAERNDLAWLARARANNTWAIAVRGDVARRLSLATMADLAAAAPRGELRLAASAEFVESPAALPAFERTYGFTFPRDRITVLPGGDTAVTMRAAAQSIGGVNAAMVYGTDGAIAALNLVALEDNRGAQVVYEPAPVVRGAVLRAEPRIATLLDPVFSALDAPLLRRLNAEIAVDGRPPEQVARRFLEARGR